ncbi:MAG: tetratricopeptide repeat protein [Alphaproteobacteria bacterium]
MVKAQHDIRASLQRAMSLHQQGDLNQAEQIYKEVLAIEPNEPNALHLLGVVAWKRGDLPAAHSHIQKAIQLHPTVAAYHSNLAGVLRQMGMTDEAIASYEKSLLLDPKHEVARKELALTLHQQGMAASKDKNWDLAQKAYSRVLELDPNNVATLNNLAAVVQHLNDRNAAYGYYRRALEAAPDNLMLRYNRSICYLTDKKFSEGWADFRGSKAHWQPTIDKRASLPWAHVPFWDGRDLKGKKILLWGDHGIGDEVLFASMVPDLIERGAIITMEVMDRLKPLMERSFPTVTVHMRQEPPLPGPNFDFQAPWLWLTSYLRPTINDFPKRLSYLKADDEQKARLRKRYEAFGKKHIIGVSWFSMSHTWGTRRSITLPEILGSLPLDDVLIIDLQYGETADAWREAKKAFPHLTTFHDDEVDQFIDMDIFAAQVAACDSVVTICNTTSHIAGALGIPAAVLMSDFGLTWYWFADGAECPWYPSLTLLRPSAKDRLKSASKIATKSMV